LGDERKTLPDYLVTTRLESCALLIAFGRAQRKKPPSKILTLPKAGMQFSWFWKRKREKKNKTPQSCKKKKGDHLTSARSGAIKKKNCTRELSQQSGLQGVKVK